MLVPFLCAASHLRSITGHQRQALETMTSSNQSGGDEVLKGETVEGPLRTSTRLDGIVDIFHRQVGTMRIVTGTVSCLLVEDSLVLFEALRIGEVDVLGKGHESRRRSVGSRHFEWRMG